MVVFCPGWAVPSPQSDSARSHCDPTPMKNLMGSVRSSSSGMSSPVSTFLNSLPPSTTSTSATPSSLVPDCVSMRYVQVESRLSSAVGQFARYSESPIATCEPANVRMTLPLQRSVIVTVGLSCLEKTCPSGACCGTRGGSQKKNALPLL